MANSNFELIPASCQVRVEPRPYSERSTDSLLYIKTILEQEDEPVPVDLIAALEERGVF